MSGYQENFLDGVLLPLPNFSKQLENEIVKDNESIRSGFIADYQNFSVIQNKLNSKRSPVVAALNIDTSKLQAEYRTVDWQFDKRLGEENQTGREFYDYNNWSRGQMVSRFSASWGDSEHHWKRASDDTFHYSNCCLQREELDNNDWRKLEYWVVGKDFLTIDGKDIVKNANIRAKGGKVSTFTGPFYAKNSRVSHVDNDFVLVPTGFYKIVCFINEETKELNVSAFVMYQEDSSNNYIQNQSKQVAFSNKIYQVTILEIEQLTGLEFDRKVIEANPFYYHEDDEAKEKGVIEFPERREIKNEKDIVLSKSKRQTLKDDVVDVFITAAMVQPSGREEESEWVSLINLSNKEVNLSGWTIKDKSQTSILIEEFFPKKKRILQPAESCLVGPLYPLMLSNESDVIELFDAENARIDSVSYDKSMVEVNKVVLFLNPNG